MIDYLVTIILDSIKNNAKYMPSIIFYIFKIPVAVKNTSINNMGTRYLVKLYQILNNLNSNLLLLVTSSLATCLSHTQQITKAPANPTKGMEILDTK